MPDHPQEPGPASSPERSFADWLARSGSQEEFEALCRERGEHAEALRELLRFWLRLEPILRLAGFGLGEEQGHSFAERLKQEYGSGVDPAIALEEGREESAPPTSELLRRLSKHGLKRSRYALKGELARGGMGAILKVWDEDLRRSLAMKVILGKTDGATGGATPPVDRRLLARFLEEAQVTGQLDHPGIVPVHELGLDAEGRVYFTMKLVKGRDLRTIFDLVFEEHEGWNETRALGVLLKVCEAMAYAHAKGVIHRDLKPANVMVGGFGEVYVMDWGLARVLGRTDAHDLRLRDEGAPLTSVKTERREEREEAPDSPLFTMDGDVVGTPAYMPPEQALGAVERLSPRSDVYAIGAMLYHLLARHMPYVPAGGRMTNRMVLAAVTQGPPAPLASLRRDAPAELVAIVERAMAREPEQRYRDTLELADDLRAYLENRVVAAYETGAWAETKKWVQRNKPLAASLAAAMLLLVSGLTASLVFKARADERAADLLAANTTIQQREAVAQKARAEADERTREARMSLYVAAVTGAQSARRLNEPANVRRLLDSAPEELRNWEWHYLDAVSDTSLFTLQGGNSASFSPDGSRIVTASQDGTARVWDATSGKELARLEGHTSPVNSASFSADGSRVVTASRDGTARVWDAVSGKELLRLEGQKRVDSGSFSPDGSRVLTVGEGPARVWDAVSGKELLRLEARWADSASFSPDGSRVLTTGDGGTAARVWDALSGKELARLGRGTKPASFSPDGSRIVVASNDHTARVWDATSGKELIRLESHTSGVNSVSFSSDGLHIVTASHDKTARVWDAASGKELTRLEGHALGVISATFSPDGARIVTTSLDNTARVWDAASGNELALLEGHTRWQRSPSFSPDGSRVVIGAVDDAARVWDVTGGGEFAQLEVHTDQVTSASFSPDGARIVTASEDTARVWNATSGKELARLEAHADHVLSTSFSVDGSRIVTASDDMADMDDMTTRVWDAASGKQLARLVDHGVFSASFSPDGFRIATASWGAVRVWDVTSSKELALLQEDGLTSFCFSPDGSRIVTASEDHIARVWDWASGGEVVRLEGHIGWVRSAYFSPDGSRIVTASVDDTARVWDAASGKELARLEGHKGSVNSACFSPDGSRIVTASNDNTARVWDAASGKEFARLEGHTSGVISASFSPDGSRIVTGSDDKTARVWDGVPYRVRFAERQALLAARPAGQRLVEDAVVRSSGFVEAGSRLRRDDSLDPLVRRVALDMLSERATMARTRAKALEAMRQEHAWLAHLIGREPWPSEREVEAALNAESRLPTDEAELKELAWRLVDPDKPPSGDEVRALLLARRAVASRPQWLTARDTLARALFRLGRFDEALEEQRRVLAEVSPEGKQWDPLSDAREYYDGRLRRLESDIATWRDESGELPRARITDRLQTLEREIAALEQDPDVRRWLVEE